jgi:hypothetical protein
VGLSVLPWAMTLVPLWAMTLVPQWVMTSVLPLAGPGGKKEHPKDGVGEIPSRSRSRQKLPQDGELGLAASGARAGTKGMAAAMDSLVVAGKGRKDCVEETALSTSALRIGATGVASVVPRAKASGGERHLVKAWRRQK